MTVLKIVKMLSLSLMLFLPLVLILPTSLFLIFCLLVKLITLISFILTTFSTVLKRKFALFLTMISYILYLSKTNTMLSFGKHIMATKFTTYTGKLHVLADGSLHFEVFLMQPPNCSIFEAIGTRNHAFNNCVVLDDNILSRLEMSIDWSHVHGDNYTVGGK